MKLHRIVSFVLLLSTCSFGQGEQHGQVTAVDIEVGSITPLHLRPDFESVIHLPEEVSSVVVGSPSTFHVEHSEAEPTFVYVKPTVRSAAHSDLLIALKSGEHVVLDLISEGESTSVGGPIDFLLEYRPRKSFVVYSGAAASSSIDIGSSDHRSANKNQSPLDKALAFQRSVNAPLWNKWDGQQIQTSLGDVRQLGGETLISYSIVNTSDQPVEILPPQIQMDQPRPKKGKGKKVLADQLQVRSFRMTTTRLEPGGRADGALIFDRPSFKSSTQSLFLQLGQADRIDRPILLNLPFTAPLATDTHQKGAEHGL